MRRRSAAFMGGPNPTLQKKSETRTSLTPFALQLLGDNANNDNSISNNNNNLSFNNWYYYRRIEDNLIMKYK